MATLKCPHCGASMPTQRTWAEIALSTVIAAPAVPDMATQSRCGTCGRVSAASELRYSGADRFEGAHILLWAVVVVLLSWALITLFSG